MLQKYVSRFTPKVKEVDLRSPHSMTKQDFIDMSKNYSGYGISLEELFAASFADTVWNTEYNPTFKTIKVTFTGTAIDGIILPSSKYPIFKTGDRVTFTTFSQQIDEEFDLNSDLYPYIFNINDNDSYGHFADATLLMNVLSNRITDPNFFENKYAFKF